MDFNLLTQEPTECTGKLKQIALQSKQESSWLKTTETENAEVAQEQVLTCDREVI